MNPLPSSQRHRLCFFPGSPRNKLNLGYDAVPDYVADEVEDLRNFVDFLYPKGGQDRFTLFRPDVNDLRWVVYDKPNRVVYGAGATPREAVRNARHRLQHETQPADIPFTLQS